MFCLFGEYSVDHVRIMQQLRSIKVRTKSQRIAVSPTCSTKIISVLLGSHWYGDTIVIRGLWHRENKRRTYKEELKKERTPAGVLSIQPVDEILRTNNSKYLPQSSQHNSHRSSCRHQGQMTKRSPRRTILIRQVRKH